MSEAHDDDSDEALMMAYAAGDASAFARLYDRHERPAWRFFVRQGVAPAVADDLLQETWIAIVRSAERYAPTARFATWLYAIARSKLVDHWRTTRAHVPIDEAANDDDDDASVVASLVAPASDEPEVRAMSRAYAVAFVAAVDALPAPQREVFLLHAEGGLGLDEIAAITASGVETVKSRLRYAMRKLRVVCAPWNEPAQASVGGGVRDER